MVDLGSMWNGAWPGLWLCATIAAAAQEGPADLADGAVIDPPPFIAAARPPPTAAPSESDLDARGYQPGIGVAWPASGRFGGRSRSDGLLDWDYPESGLIEKGYLARHPLNPSQRPWAIRFDPPRAINEAQLAGPYQGDTWGSFWGPPAAQGQFTADWIAGSWHSRLTSVGDFMGRPKGATVEVRVTYSIAMPGLLIETDDRGLRLDLEGTPGYRFVIVPLKGGPTVRALAAEKPAYDRRRDGDLADNWLLLWGSLQFPDVPLLIVPKENPARVAGVFDRTRDRASALLVQCAAPLGHVVLATPYGLAAEQPADGARCDRLGDAIARSRFWSKALLGFITDCRERFLVDEAAGTVAIAQRFVYRDLTDAWGSRPLHLAPLPPALALASGVSPAVRLPIGAVDLGFPTRHGPLHAVIGQDSSEYVLPLPPVHGRTPFAPSGPSAAAAAIRTRHTRPMHDGGRALLPVEHPGLWSRPDRSIADVSALVNEIAFLWPFLDAQGWRALRANARDFLLDCLDDQELFRETALFKSIERTPADAGKLVRPIWFDRVDPISGTTYLLSYTVPNVRRDGKSISDFPGAFTDCEWGNGLGLWGIHQMARISGAWDVIRRDWPRIRAMYALLEVQQDWAAMSASGSESGRRWTDQSCYGGYIAFREMARRIGAEADWRKGAYLHAKHVALRLALLDYAAWNHEYFGTRPYRVAHMFQEHHRGFPGSIEPMMYRTADDFRGGPIAVDRGTFYALVAEGTGYECPDLLYSLCPRIAAEVVASYRQAFPEWLSGGFVQAMNAQHMPSGGITLYEMLLFQIRDPAIPTAEIRDQLARAGGSEAIRSQLSERGFYDRFGAAPEHVQALLETRDDPGWLADWEGCEPQQAVFDRATGEAAIAIDHADVWTIRLGGRPPASVQWNGAPCLWQRSGQITVVQGTGSGSLRIRF